MCFQLWGYEAESVPLDKRGTPGTEPLELYFLCDGTMQDVSKSQVWLLLRHALVIRSLEAYGKVNISVRFVNCSFDLGSIVD